MTYSFDDGANGAPMHDNNEAYNEDLTGVDEGQDFSPLPPGKYLARCIDVQTRDKEGLPRRTQAGDTKWGLRWEPAAIITPEGKITTRDEARLWTGRSVWDDLIHSQKAAPRRKLVLSRVGVDVSRPFQLVPDLVLGRWAIITTELEKFQDKEKKEKIRARIPFRGFESAPQNAVEQIVKAGKAPRLMSEREKEETGFGFGQHGASTGPGANA